MCQLKQSVKYAPNTESANRRASLKHAGPTPSDIGLRLYIDNAMYPRTPFSPLESVNRRSFRTDYRRPLAYDFRRRSRVSRLLRTLFGVTS